MLIFFCASNKIKMMGVNSRNQARAHCGTLRLNLALFDTYENYSHTRFILFGAQKFGYHFYELILFNII